MDSPNNSRSHHDRTHHPNTKTTINNKCLRHQNQNYLLASRFQQYYTRSSPSDSVHDQPSATGYMELHQSNERINRKPNNHRKCLRLNFSPMLSSSQLFMDLQSVLPVMLLPHCARHVSSWSVVVVILYSMLMTSSAEHVFHRRNREDLDQLNPPASVVTVNDENGAVRWLSKYGYLDCNVTASVSDGDPIPRDRRDLSFMDTLVIVEDSEVITRDCNYTSDDYTRAILKVQRTYNLPQTGDLDYGTLRVMSERRCGNRDTISTREGVENHVTNETNTNPNRTASILERLAANQTVSTRVRRYAQRILDEQHNRMRDDVPDETDWSAEELEARILQEEEIDDQGLGFVEGNTLHPLKQKSPATTGSTGTTGMLSRLLDTLYAQDKIEQYSVRQLQIHNLMQDISDHKYDPQPSGTHNPVGQHRLRQRIKRSALLIQEAAGQMFPVDDGCIRYRLLVGGYSSKLSMIEQRAILMLAFRMWSEVCPICFVEDLTSDAEDLDIQIIFGKDEHIDCYIIFDGPGGEIGHSWATGNIHFDDDENYRADPISGVYLLRVAVHEIGHVLSLQHDVMADSVMYALYSNERSAELELHPKDRQAVQQVYGVCKGSFDSVFDWIRYDRRTGGIIFNSYYFRGDKMWMYERRYNRCRYGDPLYIAKAWSGVPDHVDGYAQILWLVDNNWRIATYFYKGQYVYKYDDSSDQIEAGYPKRISEEYPAKAGQTEAIPDDIDSVYFDIRFNMLYFFKDEWIYEYDPFLPDEEAGCCESKTLISEMFPSRTGSDQLVRDVDSVYVSQAQKKLYIIKGEKVWENIYYSNSTVNYLEDSFNWYDIWYDICDVE